MAAEIVGVGWFTYVILPFVLIFTLVYAILEKTKILGEARQVNAIIALVMGLILVGVPIARGIITSIVPVVVVVAFIILAFMLLLGFVGGTKEGYLGKGMQIVFGIIIALVLVVAIIWSLGLLPKIFAIAEKPWAPQLWQTLLFLAIIIAVIAIVTAGGKQKTEAQG